MKPRMIARVVTGIAAATAAIAVLIGATACGPTARTPSEAAASSSAATNAKARTIDEIQQSGVLKVAVFSDKAPFGYVDANGEYQGYDIVFARQLAKDLGVEPEFMSVDPNARVDVLTSNKSDITLANFTVTDERAKQVDFAKPYMQVKLGIVSPESDPIASVEQLKGKTLIVAKGTTAETYFSEHHPDITLQKYDQYADAYNALLDGRGDAMSTDNTEVLAWANANKGYTVGVDDLGESQTIAAAVQKGNTELLAYINDEIDRLGKERFFHKDYEQTLQPVYGTQVDPDEIVVEGGTLSD